MNIQELSTLADNIMSLQPIFQKKLLKLNHCKEYLNLCRSHIEIIIVLNKTGAAPMSEVGKKLEISKPQMTILVDKLIEQGLIERLPDKNDRRIINIQLTEKGMEHIKTVKAAIREDIKKKLSCLSEQDLIELYTSIQNVKNILSKID